MTDLSAILSVIQKKIRYAMQAKQDYIIVGFNDKFVLHSNLSKILKQYNLTIKFTSDNMRAVISWS